MFKAVSRVLFIAVMLVAFVGQAIAFNTPIYCENSVDSTFPNVSELIKHFDSDPIDTDSSEDCCGIECCDMGCICIANACSSFVYFNAEVDSIKIAPLSEAVYMQKSEQPNAITTFLYRPPIFT